MKQWLQEFKRKRDVGRTLRRSLALRTAAEPFMYEFENYIPRGKMHAGYVRAALLRAVGESAVCRIVEMPVLLWSLEDMRRFFTETHEEFRSASFSPLELSLIPRGESQILRVSVFSHEDVAGIEPLFRDAS